MKIIWIRFNEKEVYEIQSRIMGIELGDSFRDALIVEGDLTKLQLDSLEAALFVVKNGKSSDIWKIHSTWPVSAIVIVDPEEPIKLDLEEEEKKEIWFMTLIQPTFNELKTTFLAAKEILRLKSQLEKVKNQVERDPITGLNNRRGLSRRWKRESSLAKRYRHDLSVLFIDIDYFKSYNDQHGHSVGDQVLLAVSRLLKKTLREGDICARYGGDEFVIILPYTGLLEAQEVAERVRIQIESLHTPYSYSQPGGRLTLSIGVSSYPECSENVDEVWELADQALLEAKMKGKNQVCVKGQLDE